MHYVGELREKFGIPGPRNPELAQIRNKSLMKVKAEEEHIPTAKFLTVDFLTETNTEVLGKRITSKITVFPNFVKPEHGVGCGGSAKITDREELVQWITKNLNKNAVSLKKNSTQHPNGNSFTLHSHLMYCTVGSIFEV